MVKKLLKLAIPIAIFTLGLYTFALLGSPKLGGLLMAISFISIMVLFFKKPKKQQSANNYSVTQKLHHNDLLLVGLACLGTSALLYVIDMAINRGSGEFKFHFIFILGGIPAGVLGILLIVSSIIRMCIDKVRK